MRFSFMLIAPALLALASAGYAQTETIRVDL